MALIAREVQLDVTVGKFYGLGAGVDTMDELGPASHGVE
jgi:hypothetical protein